jgi:hypothetical protein
MGTYKAKCDICYAENEVPNYGDWTCSKCGQRYDYDEGHRIRLTEAQLQALRHQTPAITDLEREALVAFARSWPAIGVTVEHAETLRRLLERLG